MRAQFRSLAPPGQVTCRSHRVAFVSAKQLPLRAADPGGERVRRRFPRLAREPHAIQGPAHVWRAMRGDQLERHFDATATKASAAIHVAYTQVQISLLPIQVVYREAGCPPPSAGTPMAGQLQLFTQIGLLGGDADERSMVGDQGRPVVKRKQRYLVHALDPLPRLQIGTDAVRVRLLGGPHRSFRPARQRHPAPVSPKAGRLPWEGGGSTPPLGSRSKPTKRQQRRGGDRRRVSRDRNCSGTILSGDRPYRRRAAGPPASPNHEGSPVLSHLVFPADRTANRAVCALVEKLTRHRRRELRAST